MYDDNELMMKVQEGNKEAYEKLVIKHREKSISFANSFVFDLYAAEDIVQNCFAKIYIRRMSYKPSYSFKTYLFTVIRNACIDYLRSSTLKFQVDLESIRELEDKKALETQENKEKVEKALSIIKGLQNHYKTALYLFAVEEMTYEEIGKIMGKPVAQVKITIHRARKKLKKQYEREGHHEK